jgi:NAD(P)-dependent dehydrogenase (short-subunit alcohol dehydrogenase family)
VPGRGKLAGRVGVITGTARGIGRAGARLFASEGAALVTLDSDPDGGSETVAQVRAAGGRAEFVHGDAANAADVERAVQLAVESFGKLDLLWANASIPLARPIVATSESEWDRVLAVNAKGPFLLARFGLPQLVRAGGGTVVITGSISSVVGSPGWSAYCAAKGGVVMLARVIALEHAGDRIRANCVCPGSTDTAMVRVDAAARDIPYDVAIAQDKAAHPLNRWAQPDEIAQAALFLSCDDSSFVTGTTLMVDGGFTAQ